MSFFSTSGASSGALGVTHFRLPPDFRVPYGRDQTPNAYLTVPFLRFPRMALLPKLQPA